MSDQPSVSPPTLVSLILCDQVIDDKMTNKKSAIGLFNTIVVQRVPTAVHQMAVMASLTEFTSKVQLEIRLVRDSDDASIFSSKGFVAAPSPLAVVDLVFTWQGIRLPSAGQYAFELLHDGALLGRRRFQIMVKPQSKPKSKPSEQIPPPESDEN